MLINKKPSIKPCFMYYVRMVRLLSNILTVFQTRGGEGTSYIRMIGMIVVFFSGCNRRFRNF